MAMANPYSCSWIFYSKLLLLQRTLISISSECPAQDPAALNLLRFSLSACACALDICTFKTGKGALGAHCIPDNSYSVELAIWDEESQMKKSHDLTSSPWSNCIPWNVISNPKQCEEQPHSCCSSVHGVNGAVTPFCRRFTFWKEGFCLYLSCAYSCGLVTWFTGLGNFFYLEISTRP